MKWRMVTLIALQLVSGVNVHPIAAGLIVATIFLVTKPPIPSAKVPSIKASEARMGRVAANPSRG
jgi:hypothetical protein